MLSSKDHYTGGYDTWMPSGRRSFTDVITGRWLETHGYSRVHGGPGILEVYMPLAPPQPLDILAPRSVAELAIKAAFELREFAPGLASEPRLQIESYRWPSSIHVMTPGFLTEVAPKLAEPDGKIYYASNNLGTPSFEASLTTGWRAAREIRRKLGNKRKKAATSRP